MTAALYTSVWVGLACLVASELGRRRQGQTIGRARWAMLVSAVGVVCVGAHTLIALGGIYDWDHGQAVAVTAERAAQLYGVAWPGSLYINYLFVLWWALDTATWWRSPERFIRRSAALERSWRLVTLTMVVNGAVIFASPIGRLAGVPLTIALIAIWWLDRRLPRSPVTSHR